MSSVPAQVAEITVDWMNEVLDGRLGTITEVHAERFGEGVGILGELARLRLTYADGHSGPATMIAKCQSPSPENQFISKMMGFYEREVNFYCEVATQLAIRVPQPYHADCGDGGLPFVLLIEDISGARCPDQLAGITPGEAAKIIDLVARLHAPFWDSPTLAEMAWLPPMNNPLYQAGQGMALERLPAFADRFGERIGPSMMAAIERACHHYVDMLNHVSAQPHLTFTHTDCRAENYLFGGSAGPDAVTMVDFQLCTRHFGPWDVANLIAGSMTADVRRGCEAELIEQYHRTVTGLGVANYSLDQCWHDFRLSLLQVCTASVIVSDLQGGNERGADLLEQLFLRPIIAGIDHHVDELLEEFC